MPVPDAPGTGFEPALAAWRTAARGTSPWWRPAPRSATVRRSMALVLATAAAAAPVRPGAPAIAKTKKAKKNATTARVAD